MSFPFNTFGFVDHLTNANEFLFGNMNEPPLEFTLGKGGSTEDKDDHSSQSPSDGGNRDRRRNVGGSDRREKERRERDDLDSSGSGLQQPPQQNGGMSAAIWPGMMGMTASGYPLVGMNMIMDAAGGIMPMMPPGAAAAAMMVSEGGMLAPPNGNPDHTGAVAATSTQPPTTPLIPKEIIHCKSCTLFPPNPNAPPPTTRERPPGCRTVFVGGLPEHMTEEIIMEVFERCGEVTTLRLSKKTFCHIRFVYEGSVDAAIFLSGYRVRIGSNSDPPNTGRLHVDYAQARDDQYEWECKQRQLQREQRHRERMEEERLRPPSPPPVVHYTDHEAAAISEKIKQDDTFTKAAQVVITWLERGDCSKRNANTFYSMIQSTNSHIRRLLGEKSQYEDELQRAKEILKGRMQGILLQFSQIERLFVAACHKKVWDHFTKAQRKNIEGWKRQSLEIKNVHADCEMARSGLDDDEMDMSDGEEVPTPLRKKPRVESGVVTGAGSSGMDIAMLREENLAIKCQMEAYKNEVEVVKVDLQHELATKDKQLELQQSTIETLETELREAQHRNVADDAKLTEMNATLERHNKDSSPALSSSSAKLRDVDTSTQVVTDTIAETSTSSASLGDADAKLVCIIATFLNVHPFGAGLDYIWSYVSKLEVNVRPSELELLMAKFPSVFHQRLVGIGANIERRWLFNAYSKGTLSLN